MNKYLVLCLGKDDWHYLVEAFATSQWDALKQVDLQQNPHKILAISEATNTGQPGVRGITYRGRLHEATRADWTIDGPW